MSEGIKEAPKETPKARATAAAAGSQLIVAPAAASASAKAGAAAQAQAAPPPPPPQGPARASAQAHGDVPPPPAAVQEILYRAAAKPQMGQQAATVPAPTPVAPVPTAPMTFDEAVAMLPGLQAAVTGTEDALKAGTACPEVKSADLETARMFKDKMAQFVASGATTGTFTVQRPWLDAASKVVDCAIKADKAAPNTGAYVVLGAVLVGAIVAVSIS